MKHTHSLYISLPGFLGPPPHLFIIFQEVPSNKNTELCCIQKISNKAKQTHLTALWLLPSLLGLRSPSKQLRQQPISVSHTSY